MVSVAVCETPFRLAEIVTVVRLPTPTVAIENVVELLPPATNTVDGTVATALLLLRDRLNPAAGAEPDNFTVAVDVLPP
jgi:hypothetical protein